MAKAIREAYGEALVKYGKDDRRVVVLDADLSGSTKSGMFQKAVPERFFNMGIAEANMCSIAAGMASQTLPSLISPSPRTAYTRVGALSSRAARAIPIAADSPIPSGPVDMSTPGVSFMQGCP